MKNSISLPDVKDAFKMSDFVIPQMKISSIVLYIPLPARHCYVSSAFAVECVLNLTAEVLPDNPVTYFLLQ